MGEYLYWCGLVERSDLTQDVHTCITAREQLAIVKYANKTKLYIKKFVSKTLRYGVLFFFL